MLSCFQQRALLYLQVILICGQAFSQKKISQPSGDGFPFNHFEFFNYEQLKGRAVYQIMQDSKGFLWIINDNGLKRFDGYTFRSWPYSTSDPNALASIGGCYGMAEDDNGILWI